MLIMSKQNKNEQQIRLIQNKQQINNDTKITTTSSKTTYIQ